MIGLSYLLRFSPRFKFLKYLPVNGSVLDVGCGNCQAVKLFKTYRPDLELKGIDLVYHKCCGDILNGFKKVNLESEFLPFENESFDGVRFSHVLEHLENTNLVRVEMFRVLKYGGYIYVETPHPISLRLPCKEILGKLGIPGGPFNFYDDKTHRGKPVPLWKLELWLSEIGFDCFEKGRVHNPFKFIFSPFALGGGIIFRNDLLVTSAIWEMSGWCSYGIGKK